MKKLFIIASVVLTVVSFSSCKKDYTCTCKGNVMPETVSPINDAKKGDATDACDALETTGKLIDTGYSCTLK